MPTANPFDDALTSLRDIQSRLGAGSSSIVHPLFSPVGLPGGVSGLPILPTGGGTGPTLNTPPLGGSGTGTGSVSVGTGAGATGATSASFLSQGVSIVTCFLSPSNCLLRLIVLILGIICIIGAIYLYKPTQEIISVPARAATEAAKGIAVGAAG